MLDWIIREWREQHLGVLIVGGQVMVAGGLREQTKDIDACLAAKQCPRMRDWLVQKEAQGHAVELRLGSAPIHPDWLGRGWTCHVQIDEERLDFFGVPLRASRRFVDRCCGIFSAKRSWLNSRPIATAPLSGKQSKTANRPRSDRSSGWD
jgi:hypothetical protein